MLERVEDAVHFAQRLLDALRVHAVADVDRQVIEDRTLRDALQALHADVAHDEVAARRDALRAIAAMIPDEHRELYDLMLAVREPGMFDRIHAYADRHQIGRSTVYFRIEKLAQAIQSHPWFAEIIAPFRPLRTA